MRIVFLGTPEFAVPSLRALLGTPGEVCAVFTQPDRPGGRGRKPLAPAVKSAALAAGLPVFQPEKIRDPESRIPLEPFQPDLIVVVAYGQILPPWLLRLPRLGCVNVHASLLPRYRGAAPVAWAVLNGESVTGITTMLMDEHLDTGPILLQKDVEIGPMMSAGELAATLAEVGARLLTETVKGLCAGTIVSRPQDHGLATYAPRITKEMAEIQWEQEAALIHNRIRGLNPWPLAHTEFRGISVQLIRSRPQPGLQARQAAPGTFLGCTATGMNVSCGEGGMLELLELQPADKRKMSGRDFANGARLKSGDRLVSESDPP
jgi:methionyl-tRNA formyltransferase